MTLPIIPFCFRCVFHWNSLGGADHAVSVQHFSSPDLALDSVAAAIDASVQTHQFEGLTDDTIAETVDVTPLDGTTATQTFGLNNWHGSSGSGDPLIGQAIMVEGQTGIRGPSNRGRLFLPSPVESVVTTGELILANANEIAAAWNDYQTALIAADLAMGVASYTLQVFNPYVSFKVPTRLGRIRRRQPGH